MNSAVLEDLHQLGCAKPIVIHESIACQSIPLGIAEAQKVDSRNARSRRARSGPMDRCCESIIPSGFKMRLASARIADSTFAGYVLEHRVRHMQVDTIGLERKLRGIGRSHVVDVHGAEQLIVGNAFSE
jgi:hypothetical protein